MLHGATPCQHRPAARLHQEVGRDGRQLARRPYAAARAGGPKECRHDRSGRQCLPLLGERGLHGAARLAQPAPPPQAQGPADGSAHTPRQRQPLEHPRRHRARLRPAERADGPQHPHDQHRRRRCARSASPTSPTISGVWSFTSACASRVSRTSTEAHYQPSAIASTPSSVLKALFGSRHSGQKQVGRGVQLRARLRDLVRMHVELLGHLGQHLLALYGGQSHLRLGSRCVVPAWSSRHYLSCAAYILAAFRQKLHLSRCSDFLSQLYARLLSHGSKASILSKIRRYVVKPSRPGQLPCPKVVTVAVVHLIKANGIG